MFKQHVPVIFLILLLSAKTTYAENITVYRWVDENNVVHFSQHQPDHQQYTELTLANTFSSPRVNKPIDDKPEENSAEPEEDNNAQLITENDNKECSNATENVKTLSTFDKIQFTDADGNVRVLSKKEKQQQLALNQKKIEIYCEASD